MNPALEHVRQFVRRYPWGIAAPILLIGTQLVADFNGPDVLVLLFGLAGAATFLIHFVSTSRLWLSKRKSYGAALLDQILPVIAVWIAVVFLRAGLMWVLGKPL